MSANNGESPWLSPKEVDQILWDKASKEDDFVVTEFGVAIIGIGALFFAYGSLAASSNTHLRAIIALVGFGASLVVWTHSWSARRSAEETRKAIVDPLLNEKWKQVNKWRGTGWNRWLFYPVTQLVVYFSGLVALAWGTLSLLTLFRLPTWVLEGLDIGGLAATFVYAIAWRRHMLRKYDREFAWS